MSNSAEISESHPRPDKEQITLSLLLSQADGPLFVAAQAALTYLIDEKLNNVAADKLALIAGTAFLTTSLLGFIYEVETLKEKGFTLNTATNLAFLKINNPYLANAVGTLYGYLSYFTNPADVYATAGSWINNDGGHLLMANLLARTITGFTKAMSYNWLIRHGYAEEFLEKFSQFFDRFRTQALDEIIYSAQIRTILTIPRAAFL